MPYTKPSDRYSRTNALAQPSQQQPAPQPQSPWMAQPKPLEAPTGNSPMPGQFRPGTPYSPNPNILANPVPPLPGDPVGQPGYSPAPQQPVSFGNDMMTHPGMMPTSPGMTAGNAMASPYGANGGGMRVNPNYLPENWNYQESPEYRQRLAWAQRDLNRQLLSMGRSDSTGGINAMARQQGEMAGQEIDKQYQRALQANMTNYGRMFGANVENYGRTRGEDQTGWDRAAYLDQTGWNRGAYLGEQDWNRNYQLANMGLGATNTGVNAGNQAGANLANLLSGNGANQASLALQRGAVSADQIQGLLNSGWNYLQIEQLFGNRGGAPMGSALGGVPGTQAPGLPAYSGAGVGNPGSYQGGMYAGGGATPGFDFFS